MPRRLVSAFTALLAVLLLTVPGAFASETSPSEPPAPADELPITGRAASFPADTNYLRFMPFTNGGSDRDQIYTQAEAVALARRFDVIVALLWTFDDYVPAMKAANPDLKLIVYMNGGMSRKVDQRGMPEQWFLHDANGRRVQNLHFPLTYMDVAQPGWRDWTANKCTEWIRASGYDGCYLDDLGAGNLGTNLSAWPIDPRTGQRITAGNWITYASGLVRAVKAKHAGDIVVSNGLNSGRRYFSDDAKSYRMLEAADGSQAEGWIRGSGAPASKWPTEAGWKQDIDMLVDAGRKGKTIFAATKIWVPASAALVNQWRAYTYASFLLGTDGKQFLFFSHTGPGKPSPVHPWDSINIGRPTGAYGKVNGVYQRNFSAGKALVNPTTATVTVPLGATYIDLAGNRVTSIRMAPNTGQILRLPGAGGPGPTPTPTPNPTPSPTPNPTPSPTPNPTPSPTPNPTPSPTPGPGTIRCNGVPATIVGTAGDDLLRGTDGRDVIVGLGGNDTIVGGGGNDIICAGDGNDKVYAGTGHDWVAGGQGADAIRGDAGNDTIIGGAGPDVLSGGLGVDVVVGGLGPDACKTGGQPTDSAASCERLSRT